MATLPPITVGEQWVSLGAAPITFSVLTNGIQVAAGAATPSAAIIGHPYSAGTGDSISSGPNVYGKSDGGTSIVIVTVA